MDVAEDGSTKSPTTPNVQLLWEELRTQYSACTGARKAALLQEMWTTPIQESEDPMPRLASIRSAHAQINASSGLVSSDNSSTLSDEMLAFAMTMALPASYSTLQQTLWLRAPLTSAEVQNAVQAEFSRRKLHNPAALVARTSGNKPFTKKPNDNTKYCNYHKKNGHTTDECFTLKRIRQRQQQPSADIAQVTADQANAQFAEATDFSSVCKHLCCICQPIHQVYQQSNICNRLWGFTPHVQQPSTSPLDCSNSETSDYWKWNCPQLQSPWLGQSWRSYA